ncbi:hypothetical protein HanOQP8_Chr09g0315811 [Helianthus annuus]|nr:hypothetical protein HanOQP8_Chr09g0315811 [Helianthus annuus]
MFTHRIKCDGYIYSTIERETHIHSFKFSFSLSNLLIMFKSSKISLIIFKFFPALSRDLHLFLPDILTMSEEEIVPVEEGAVPVPVLKWDQGLFEQILRGFQFPVEWDAHYPQQGLTAADAPPGYITLFADFFLDDNFCLPATTFMARYCIFMAFIYHR